jgi:hypothetical protein
MNYTNEAVEDFKEWSNFPTSAAPFEVSSSDRALLTLHNLLWSPSRAIDSACRPEGLTFHALGAWKIEGDHIRAFNGGSYWQCCVTRITPEIMAAIEAISPIDD